MENSAVAKIEWNQQEKNYDYKNTLVLTTSLKNFKVEIANSKFAQTLINRVLLAQENYFVRNNTAYLYPQAVKNYIESQKNPNGHFNPFGADLTYNVTYNDNCVLSFYYDTYNYTGGAHGSTIKKSNTFSLLSGRQLKLSNFFYPTTPYRRKILEEILRQARINNQQDEGLYFDDYERLIVRYFNPNSFYLTPEGIVIYYQQYDIAPYAVGMPEFLITNDLLDILPNCRFY